MNLSEALDAALPEMPKTRTALGRPPMLDPELVVREDELDGEKIIAVLQREKGNFFRLQPMQWQLACFFDGARSYEDIAELFATETGAYIAPDEVRQFADNMEEAGFWFKTAQEKNLALSQKLRDQRSRRAGRTSKVNLAHISFSAWDPDRYFDWLNGILGNLIFSSWSVMAMVLLFLFETVVFIANWSQIGPDVPLYYNFTHKSLLDLAQFWLLFLIMGFLHESAHGLTCKHYGGQVHGMGLMFMYLMPAFFCDVTEAWVSASRAQRLATIIAGIWVEMVVCGIAMVIWTNTVAGQWIHDFSYQIILITGIAVVVVNLNPLIKLDGYYFFTEFIGIPDLKERSTAFVSGWFQSRILGLPVEAPVVLQARGLLCDLRHHLRRLQLRTPLRGRAVVLQHHIEVDGGVCTHPRRRAGLHGVPLANPCARRSHRSLLETALRFHPPNAAASFCCRRRAGAGSICSLLARPRKRLLRH